MYVDTLSNELACTLWHGQPLLECALLYYLKVSFCQPSNRQHNAVTTPNISSVEAIILLRGVCNFCT